MRTSIVFDTRIDDLSEVAREFTYEATRKEQPWDQGGVQKSQVSILWSSGLWAHLVS